MDLNNPEYKAACEEAYRQYPDDIEPVDYHPRGKIVVDRGGFRFAFIQGWLHAQKKQGS
jgi:hypothetical protein